MKIAIRGVIVLTLLSGIQMAASAQRQYTQLTRLEEAIERKIADDIPGWRRRSVSPASLEPNFINDKLSINHWLRGNKNVRIVLAQYASGEEAAINLRRFARHMRTNTIIPGLGDEAYLYGIENGIAFRKSNLLVYLEFYQLRCKQSPHIVVPHWHERNMQAVARFYMTFGMSA